MKDYEGLIPVKSEESYYFVVDCPRLHVIPGTYMGPGLHSDVDVCPLRQFLFVIMSNALRPDSRLSTVGSVHIVSRPFVVLDRFPRFAWGDILTAFILLVYRNHHLH